MNSIEAIFTAQNEIKKSNFLTYLVPYSKFKSTLESLKTEHPKAVHIVWAYRVLNKYNQIVENQSDDGEPKGTSGMPSLNALRGANLINCAVFVVRYFGGIKLGTGGLVRAYSGAVNAAIGVAKLIKFEQKSTCLFFTPFALLARFEHYFERQNLKEFERDFGELGAIWQVEFKDDEFAEFYKFSHELGLQGFCFLALPLFAKKYFKD